MGAAEGPPGHARCGQRSRTMGAAEHCSAAPSHPSGRRRCTWQQLARRSGACQQTKHARLDSSRYPLGQSGEVWAAGRRCVQSRENWSSEGPVPGAVRLARSHAVCTPAHEARQAGFEPPSHGLRSWAWGWCLVTMLTTCTHWLGTALGGRHMGCCLHESQGPGAGLTTRLRGGNCRCCSTLCCARNVTASPTRPAGVHIAPMHPCQQGMRAHLGRGTAWLGGLLER